MQCFAGKISFVSCLLSVWVAAPRMLLGHYSVGMISVWHLSLLPTPSPLRWFPKNELKLLKKNFFNKEMASRLKQAGVFYPKKAGWSYFEVRFGHSFGQVTTLILNSYHTGSLRGSRVGRKQDFLFFTIKTSLKNRGNFLKKNSFVRVRGPQKELE